MKHFRHSFSAIVGMLLPLSLWAQDSVKVQGAMRNIMKKGQLQGTILLDTIANKEHLYGIGPVAYLKGELLIIDGQAYKSTVAANGSVQVVSTYQVEAPFFVYDNVQSWKTYRIPKTVTTMKDVETFIDKKMQRRDVPFIFKIEGEFEQLDFHIQNLPDGTIVKSPQDAHQGQGKYSRHNVTGTIVGFFSRKHHTIFTHHDTNMHLHFINTARSEMGHVDQLKLHKKKRLKVSISK